MSVVIDGYTIDAALRETHSREADLSDYPVEEGADVTDNVRARPKMIEIEGIVSDTPIGTMATLRNGSVGSSSANGELLFLPTDEALAKLEEIFSARKGVTVETAAKTYENMVLTALEVPIDITTGEALRFTASFREIILVQVNRTTVRVSAPTGAGKRNAGNHTAGTLVDGPNKGGSYVGPSGKPFEGFHWDPKRGAYVDKDDSVLITQTQNSTYWDPDEDEFVNSDGTPVTRSQLHDGLTHGGLDPQYDPWWKDGG